MKLADKIAGWLHEQGTQHVFTVTGAGVVSLLDSIANQGKIKIVPFHHEQAAAMAAAYYYRTSWRLAPVVCTIGAGSSNPLTGVLAAYMDSIPVMVISGNEPLHFFGTSGPRIVGIQGYRSASLAREITKYSAQAQTPADAMTILRQCYEDALSGRQGPCWLEIPRDLWNGEVS